MLVDYCTVLKEIHGMQQLVFVKSLFFLGSAKGNSNSHNSFKQCFFSLSLILYLPISNLIIKYILTIFIIPFLSTRENFYSTSGIKVSEMHSIVYVYKCIMRQKQNNPDRHGNDKNLPATRLIHSHCHIATARTAKHNNSHDTFLNREKILIFSLKC